MAFLTLPAAILALIGLYFLHQYILNRLYGAKAGGLNLDQSITSEEIRAYISKNNSRKFLDVDINRPFPWERRTSLVIYSDVSPGVHPDKLYPSLVFHQHNAEASGIIADGAPCLIECDYDHIQQMIAKWKANPCDQNDLNNALIAEQWVAEQASEYFFIEMEPPEFAGNAYPWAWHAEKKL